MFLLVKHKRSLCKAGIKQTCYSFMCSSASHRADCDSCCTPHLFIAPASPLGGDVVTAYLISLPKCPRPTASGVTVSQHQPLNQLYNSRLYIHFTFVLLHHWLVARSDLTQSSSKVFQTWNIILPLASVYQHAALPIKQTTSDWKR